MAPATSWPQPVDGTQLAAAAEVLRHLADPTRLHLLRLLATGEQDVGTLTAQVEASRSSVSQHLGRLRLAGLVHARRDGRRMRYRIAGDHLRALVDEALQFAWHEVHGVPHHGPHDHDRRDEHRHDQDRDHDTGPDDLSPR